MQTARKSYCDNFVVFNNARGYQNGIIRVVSGSTCESWYHHNVRVTERKQRKVFSNHYYHKYQGKDVIGYICSDEPPQ